MKKCTLCHKEKQLNKFHKNRTKLDGLQNVCKACRKNKDDIRIALGENATRCRIKYQRLMLNPSYVSREYKRKSIWREANRDLHNTINQHHYQHDKIPYMMRAKNRRAREKNAPGILTTETVEARFALYGYRCAYCHQSTKLTIDHVKPLILGGSNWPGNIVPACKPCNSRKKHRFLLPKLPYHPHLPSLIAEESS